MNNEQLPEEWRDIEGYDGHYQVSSSGRVRSIDWLVIYKNGIRRIHKGRILKQKQHPTYGYMYVGLNKNRVYKTYRVHRLVASTFIPNEKGKDQVNHKDLDRSNNMLANLEWCNASENQLHSYANNINRKRQRHRLGMTGKLSVSSKPVLVKSISGEIMGNYDSLTLAAAATGSNPSKISACCRGVRKAHNNLKFELQ